MGRSYYYRDIQNPNTGQQVRVTAADTFSLANKAERLHERWERERLRDLKVEMRQLALEQAEEAQADIESLRTILQATLNINDRVDWISLLDKRPFPGSEPKLEDYRAGSISKSLSFIPALRKKANEQSATEELAHQKAHQEYASKRAEWELTQKQSNTALARKKLAYEKGTNDGIETYISMVLDRSEYPDVITVNNELFFEEHGRTLLVELDLPSKETFPVIESYKFVSVANSIEPKYIKAKDFAKLYDDVQYRIVLRTIHEIFESDYKQHIQAVVINGNTDVPNKGTGSTDKKPIMTIQVQRSEFMDINLANVDPASCFSPFKGVTAGSLVELSPVRPIMKLDRKDHCIIQASDVLQDFDPTQNLATMEWEKFEVLIRDLIQKEFSGDGATVEVTRASRDAGVDAIAFDEDPIRGGKFVIQAKRYNNLVPLSAVRDLYGTVHNEGAVKGILVTTSYYGPDAVSFVKDKPLTLINGEQLLYMFEKHGYDFKIELQKKRAASYKMI